MPKKVFVKNLIFNLFWIMAAYPPCFGAALLWPFVDRGSHLTIIIAAVILSRGLKGFFQGKGGLRKLEHFLVFLEYLSSKAAAGYTLDSALISAYGPVARQTGSKSRIAKSLEKLSSAYAAGLDIKGALRIFDRSFRCDKSRQFTRILPYLQRYGGRSDNYVRQTHRALNEELNTQREIAAEQSAKNSEAVILIFMPFIIVFALENGATGYMKQMQDLKWGIPAMHILYIAAMVAATAALSIMAGSDPYRSSEFEFQQKSKMRVGKIGHWAADRVVSYAPHEIGFKAANACRLLYRYDKYPFALYLRKKLLLFGSGTFAAALLYFSGCCENPLILSAGLILALAQDGDLIAKHGKIKERYRIEYPDFLSVTHILLQSGLSLDKALELQHACMNSSKSILAKDLAEIRKKINAGENASEAVFELSRHVPSNEIAASLQVISRYESDGGSELLNILQLQASSCRSVYRNAMRKSLERKSLLLIIPLMLDLLIVMGASVLPALAGFQL